MHLIWQVDLLGLFIWKLDLIPWPFWMGSHCRHRSATTSSPVTDSFKLGGISKHFIWQVDLVEHFIWKVDLILWLFWMDSHWRHRWGNSWSAVTGSFMGGISESEHFIWKYELISDVCVHFILFTSSDNYGGYIWQLIWALHLKTWTHLPFYALLHRKSFCITYKRPNNIQQKEKYTKMFIKKFLQHKTQINL